MAEVGPLRKTKRPAFYISMKRLVWVILILVLLCACQGRTSPETTADVPPASMRPVAEIAVEPKATARLLVVEQAAGDPEADAVPAPTPVPTPTVEPEPSPTPEPTPDPPFTLAWASDTQAMIAYYQEMLPGFTAMCQWIADHAQERNIVAFLHTGDMVDNPTNKYQWNRFTEGMRVIADKMPLFVTLGNHDFYDGTQSHVWTRQFYFQDIPAKQRYREGQASYMELSVGSMDLLLIQMAFREQNNRTAIQWLRDVCKAYADRPVIFVVHGYLSNEGKLMTAAQLMEKELVAASPNIRLILCGHSRGIARQIFTYDDDGDGVEERSVCVLMHDLQEDRNKYGYFNLLTYDPAANTLSVDSYSPFMDDYIYDDEHPNDERFTIENVF